MSFDSELKSRIFTVILGLPIVLGFIIYASVWGTWVLAAVISILTWLEYSAMVYQLSDKKLKRLVTLMISMGVFFSFLAFPDHLVLVTALSFVLLSLFFVFITYKHQDESIPQHVRELCYGFFGIFYLTICPIFLPLIRGLENGVHLVLLFLLINWFNDVAAYFFGKKFGQQKLYEKISPKKSWEGALAGVCAGLLVSISYGSVFLLGLSLVQLVFLALIICFLAQCGDLLESLIKRSFNVKDSGRILPGHGGVLDRFDGVLLSAPVMYLCIMLFYSF